MSSNDARKMIDAAVESALSRLRPQLVDAVLAGLPEPAPAAPPPAPSPSDGAASGLDVDGLRRSLFTMMDGSGQVEILNSLMASVTTYWDRAVLFLVKGTSFQPWDARGFESGIGNDGAKAVVVPQGEATILAASLSGDGSQAANHLLDRLGAARGSRAAVPLGIRNKPAAVLYCDGPKGDAAVAVATMEILARTTAAAIELGMLQKRTPPFVRSEAVVGISTAAPQPTPPSTMLPALAEAEMDVEVEVEEVPVEPAAPAAPAPGAWPSVPAASPPPVARPAPEPSAWPAPSPAAVEMPPTPAIKAAPEPGAWPAPAPAMREPEPEPEPEPATAPEASAWSMPTPVAKVAPAPEAAPPAEPAAKAVEAPAEVAGTLDPRELLKGGAKPVVDAGQASSPKVTSRWKPVREQMKTGEVIDPAMAAIPEADRAKHVEARKIARLLVSEIKLYNEAKVAVGRKNRDLYERLKEDIERSRQTYVQRIDPDVAAKSNYFHDELVATLAEGDSDAMGAGH